ncbi:MAG TPA: 50S ribosomal protein L25 [Blastocatellia bacterium]|jgi:large subunit ribosomal protein L25|nr:50S ribosomal protein L25 [Blastocatellia bacterium]
MIKDLTINARSREGMFGKGHSRRLRAQGMIPVAIYGEGKEPFAGAVNAKDIANILRSDTGHNTIFKLALPDGNGGEPATVIIKDYQVDPVKGRLLHADLMRLSMTTATHVSVAIETLGEPVGVKLEGGILELQLREIMVECLPGDIPENLQVDVANLHVGDHVTVADLTYDRDKIKLLVDESQIIAGVLAPRMAEEAAPTAGEAEAAAGGEPEVIKKGKTDEE